MKKKQKIQKKNINNLNKNFNKIQYKLINWKNNLLNYKKKLKSETKLINLFCMSYLKKVLIIEILVI